MRVVGWFDIERLSGNGRNHLTRLNRSCFIAQTHFYNAFAHDNLRCIFIKHCNREDGSANGSGGRRGAHFIGIVDSQQFSDAVEDTAVEQRQVNLMLAAVLG